PLLDGVFHFLVLIQRAVAARVDRRVVDENVGSAVIGGDETEPLVRVEPLHGSLSHLLSPPGTSRRPTRLRGSAGLPAARGNSANGATPTAKMRAPQRSQTSTTANASSVPGGRLIPDPPSIFQAGCSFGVAGAKQGRIGGDLSACCVSPGVSGGRGKRTPPPLASGQACLVPVRHRDPAGRGHA